MLEPAGRLDDGGHVARQPHELLMVFEPEREAKTLGQIAADIGEITGLAQWGDDRLADGVLGNLIGRRSIFPAPALGVGGVGQDHVGQCRGLVVERTDANGEGQQGFILQNIDALLYLAVRIY